MEFQEVIEKRYSVREYVDKAVEEEKINAILEAGRLAPTARNGQPQLIYVIKSNEGLEKVKKLTLSAFNSPIVFMICGDKNREKISSVSGISMMPFDVTIVQTHMMLKATDLGLGSCWVCHFKPSDATEIFNLPKNVVPYSLLFVGYPADNATPKSWHYESVKVEDYVKYL